MMTLILSFLIGAVSLHADPWRKVLEPVGLTKADLKLDTLADSQFGGGQSPPALLKPLREDPLRIPEYARIIREALLGVESGPAEAIIFGLARVGTGVRRTLVGDPLAKLETEIRRDGALDRAVAKVFQAAGKSGAQRKSNLPKEVDAIAAYLVLAAVEAHNWRQLAFEKIANKPRMNSKFRELMGSGRGGGEDAVVPSLARGLATEVNFKQLMAGGIDLAHAVARAREKINQLKPIPEKFHFETETPWGRIVVSGPGTDDVYPAGRAFLLILDFGGGDRYAGGAATTDFAHPASMIVDVSGDDKYVAPDVQGSSVAATKDRKAKRLAPAFGAGVFGYGILADFGGNDTYRALSATQGRGAFGVGLLWDVSGDDSYDCYTQCQGSAAYGGGFLIDGSGKDTYSTFQQAQGFGASMGAGLLIDNGGEDDVYLSHPDQIDFPASMSQGFGIGHRADFTDGQSQGGGVGILVDGGGNNDFRAGVYSQGAGYWYGVGILSVGDGNDRYSATKYSQGAGVHYAVGILNDTGGNDTYKVDQELGLGEGHDFAVGFLLEDLGNDSYQAPALALGCGSANGLGFFWDKGGDDNYVAPEKLSLGCAAFRTKPPSLREYTRTIGVFIDTGGKNKLESPLKGPGPNRRWTNPPEGPEQFHSKLLGVGIMSAE